MNQESYEQDGWDKLSVLAERASDDQKLQDALREINSSDEMIEFLGGPVTDFDIPVFVEQDFDDIRAGLNNTRIITDIVIPNAKFWVYFKMPEDFLDM